MPSCLGIYVDNNLIQYAKLKKDKGSYKIEACNVEAFTNLRETLNKIIVQTNSQKDSISINISNELYNYFDVFSELENKDIQKSLDIEFEILCEEKNYNKQLLESRYLLMNSKENNEKLRAIYFSANKEEIEERMKLLSDYKLSSITSILTSITNLINDKAKENVAIINIENEVRITTIMNGQISRVDILNSGLEKLINLINKSEHSFEKSYDLLKNITIYDNEIHNLEPNENEYVEIAMPVIEKMLAEIKKILGSFKEKVTKVYITGIGATIKNMQQYFEETLGRDIDCKILKPFFLEQNDLSENSFQYIEANSAIAIALNGLGFMNKNLNFIPASKFENIDNFIHIRENVDANKIKNIFKESFSIQEKTITRAIIAVLMFIICYSCMSVKISNQINDQKAELSKKIEEIAGQIEKIDNELVQVNSFVTTYSKLIDSVSSTPNTNIVKDKRTILKDSIPNFLNKIMQIIPQKVQIVSIKNTEGKHIVIEVVSEKYEQLGYFLAAIKTEKVLENIQSTSGEKSDSLVMIKIEGDLP